MTGQSVVNEFIKMRRLRMKVVAAVLVAMVIGLSVLPAVTSPGFDASAPGAWNRLLAGMSLGIPLVCPLLLAVLASRQVDIEHQANGWVLSATSGVNPGGLCRSKFAALSTIVLVATTAMSILVLGAGMLLGIRAAVPAGQWIGFTACMLIVNLVVLGFHVLFSAVVDNQLVGLGVGVLGTLIAVFATGLPAWVAHLAPWGYYALAQGADYRGNEVVALPLPYPSIVALCVVGGVLFGLITGRFDRQEA